ncbi:MAG: hypothetical protein IJA91_00745 [Clostridia bacterium]|nr:hypothetical protein [Clostridia bacterium]
MNKKLLAILTAALLLLSATSCNDNPAGSETTDEFGTKNPNDSYIVVGTDEQGNPVTSVTPNTQEPETDGNDPSEANPVFNDVSKKVVVISAVATVRTSTQVLDNNGVGWPTEGKELTVTGESTNWFRITYNVNGEDTTCYIAKTVAADASGLEGFTAIENGEEVEVTVEAVNVRSYPSTASTLSIRGTLKLGDKVTRVAVNENWSRILYEVVSETETDAEGNPVKETKHYYISNDCLKAPSAETTAAAE